MSSNMVYYVGETALRKLWGIIKNTFVPKTIKVNGKPLTGDITITDHASVTISHSAWEDMEVGFNDTFVVECSKISEHDDLFVVPAPNSIQDWYDCNVRCSAQGNGTISFETDSSFNTDLTANILIIKGADS